MHSNIVTSYTPVGQRFLISKKINMPRLFDFRTLIIAYFLNFCFGFIATKETLL